VTDYDAPYWLVGYVDLGPRVPWSGEVVPLDVPPVPVDIPVAGPVLHFIGEGEHAVWNDVWGFIKHTATKTVPDIISIEEHVAQFVSNKIESWVGASLQATASFVNDLADYTAATGAAIIGDVAYIWTSLQHAIDYLDGAVYAILADVVGIDNIVIPGLESEIKRLGIDVWNLVGHAVDGVESWAIDNIRDPLTAEIEREIASVRTDVWNLTGAWVDELTSQINAERLARLAALGAVAAAVAEATTWINDCGEPMCQQLGPKTDLGKFLKGLKVAEWLAILAYLASLDEAKIESLLRTVAAGAEGVFDELGAVFGGAGTIRDVLP
jgi:hypothetical protein